MRRTAEIQREAIGAQELGSIGKAALPAARVPPTISQRPRRSGGTTRSPENGSAAATAAQQGLQAEATGQHRGVRLGKCQGADGNLHPPDPESIRVELERFHELWGFFSVVIFKANLEADHGPLTTLICAFHEFGLEKPESR